MPVGGTSGGDVKKFGSLGSGDGQFNCPVALALARAPAQRGGRQELVVLEAGNTRFQVFRV